MTVKKDNRIKLSPEQKEEIKQKHAAGKTAYSLAKEYDVSDTTIFYIIYPERLENNRKIAVKNQNFNEQNRLRVDRWRKKIRNEHSIEINENADSIKVIKDKLDFKTMREIKIRGQLDESGLPYTFMYVVNKDNNLKTAFPLTTVIDTGSAVSLIKTEIAAALGFKIIGTSTLQRPIEPDLELNVFNASIVVNDNLIVSDLKLKELTSKNYPCELILGMDIIKHCDFYYHSKDRLFDLIFHVPDLV